MAVSGLLGKRNLDGLKVEVLPGGEIYAGRPGRVELRVGHSRRVLGAFLLEFDLGEQPALVPLLLPRQRQRLGVEICFDQRGPQTLPPLWVRSRFPVNFFIRSLRLPLRGEVLVFPAPRPAEPVSTTGLQPQRSELQQQRRGEEGDLQSIADYRGQEPLRSVHWKLSARHQELKVKQLSTTASDPVVIDLADLSGRLEDRLSQACYLVRENLRQQRPVGLRLGRQQFPPEIGARHRLRLLSALAGYHAD